MNLEKTITAIKRKPRSLPSGIHDLPKDHVLQIIDALSGHQYFAEAIYKIGVPYIQKGVFTREEALAFIKKTSSFWDSKAMFNITYFPFDFAMEEMLFKLDDLEKDEFEFEFPNIKMDVHFINNHEDVLAKKKDTIKQVSKYIKKLAYFNKHPEVNKLINELEENIAGDAVKATNNENRKKIAQLDFIDSEVHYLKEAVIEELSNIDKKIYGLILFYAQEELRLYLNFEEKEKFHLYETDLWIEGNSIPLDHNHSLSPYEIGMEQKDFENEDFDESQHQSFNFFLISTIMSLAVVEIKNDKGLKKHFNESLKVGISLDETNTYPTFHGSYFGGSQPNINNFKTHISKITSNKKNLTLLNDLAKKTPQTSGKKLLDQLTYQK